MLLILFLADACRNHGCGSLNAYLPLPFACLINTSFAKFPNNTPSGPGLPAYDPTAEDIKHFPTVLAVGGSSMLLILFYSGRMGM